VFTFEQRAVSAGRTLRVMRLQSIKMILAAVWLLVAVVVGVAAGVTSAGGRVALAALGLLPPLAMLLLWNDPPETMSERIRQGRR